MSFSRSYGPVLICCLALGGCSVFTQPSAKSTATEKALAEAAESYEAGHQRSYQSKHPPLPPPLLVKTPEVQQELRNYLFNGMRTIREAYARREELLHVLQQIFRDEGVPHELINLAIVESGFKPDARSGAGATGLWQFMKPTARIYGLRITLFEDQRKDPILSSIAAARHLRDLYLSYRDWHLALAAYNAGTAGIDRALVKSGTTDFWWLCRSKHLNKETSRFVPRYIAASLIVKQIEISGYDRLAENLLGGMRVTG